MDDKIKPAAADAPAPSGNQDIGDMNILALADGRGGLILPVGMSAMSPMQRVALDRAINLNWLMLADVVELPSLGLVRRFLLTQAGQSRLALLRIGGTRQ